MQAPGLNNIDQLSTLDQNWSLKGCQRQHLNAEGGHGTCRAHCKRTLVKESVLSDAMRPIVVAGLPVGSEGPPVLACRRQSGPVNRSPTP